MTKCRAVPQSLLFLQACWCGTRVQQALEWFCCSPLHFWFLFCTFLYRKLSGNPLFPPSPPLSDLSVISLRYNVVFTSSYTSIKRGISHVFLMVSYVLLPLNLRSTCNFCAADVMLCWGCFHISTLLQHLQVSEVNNFLHLWLENHTVLNTSFFHPLY